MNERRRTVCHIYIMRPSSSSSSTSSSFNFFWIWVELLLHPTFLVSHLIHFSSFVFIFWGKENHLNDIAA